MESAQLAPSQARKMVLDQHSVLRSALSKIERQAHAVTAEGVGGDSLCAALRDLVDGLARHMDFEELHLPKLLREAGDAWAQDRVDHFYADHVQQREILRTLVTAPERRTPRELGLLVLGFVLLLRTDMEHEEAAVLGPDVLKDDPIVTRQEAE